MEFFRRTSKPLTPLFAMIFLYFSIQVPVMAEMVSTQSMVKNAQAKQQREKILKFYDRTEVKSALEKHGISTEEAKKRVASLTDKEVQLLASKIDKMPAGAGAESILVIFLILIILELIGITNIFSFI